MSLSFAIIGCGRIAKRHAEQIAKVGNLVAVCDVVEEKANELAKIYSAKAYYDLNDLLKQEKHIDIVSICTPNGLHANHTILSLQANCHVLCEKPMSISTTDGLKMIATAKELNKRLFVVKSARYNPLVLALKKLITQGNLGQIFSFQLTCIWNRPKDYYIDNWRGTNELDGGTLYTQFSHYIDILLWLLGEQKSMHGYRKNLNHQDIIQFEDTGAIALDMKNGAIGTIHYSVNAVARNQEISLNIVASNGTIQLGGAYMNEILYQQPELIDKALLKEINEANNYGSYKGSISNHDKVYENVVKALHGEETEITDGNEALKTVTFIETFYNNIKLS